MGRVRHRIDLAGLGGSHAHQDGHDVANDTDATHCGFQLQLSHGILRRSMKGKIGWEPVLPGGKVVGLCNPRYMVCSYRKYNAWPPVGRGTKPGWGVCPQWIVRVSGAPEPGRPSSLRQITDEAGSRENSKSFAAGRPVGTDAVGDITCALLPRSQA